MVEELRQSWKENKIILSLMSIILAGLLSWGIWVTHGVYVTTFNQDKLVGLCTDIDIMQKDLGSLKIKMDVQTVKFDLQVLKAETNQVEILKNQAEIIRELRRK